MSSFSECCVDDGNSTCSEEDLPVENVQLGFVDKKHNDLFHNPDWNTWDGGKVGGFPVWLNPTGIPIPTDLECKHCHSQLTFLLQIYCPLDDVKNAFHRSLYLFCCKNRECIANECVKCFRNQLPECNPFYCLPGSTLDSDIHKPNLCCLCGCRATSTCSNCKVAHYCSRSHQKIHWKAHKVHCKNNTAADIIPTADVSGPIDIAQFAYVFPEYEIVVEDEELDEEAKLDRDTNAMKNATVWEDAVTKGDADEASDAALTQTDYNKALGGDKHDPVYIDFLTRIEQGGTDQILRYNRWDPESVIKDDKGKLDGKGEEVTPLPRHGPLLLSHDPEILKRIQCVPNCERCGAPRAFEFQVMPQLLHFLQVDKKTVIVGNDIPAETIESENSNLPAISENDDDAGQDTSGSTDEVKNNIKIGSFQNKSAQDIDWGSIDVYTCTASCSGVGQLDEENGSLDFGGYQSEYIIIQPPPVTCRAAKIEK